MDIHPSHAALYLTAGFVIVSLVWRKVSLADPLRRFPGPSLAKRTRLYRVYYDVVVGGGWLSHLRDLHELYGPVVRVGPNELHFSDPSAYADIYSSSAKMLKDPHLYTMFNFGLPPNVFTETDPKEHTVFKSMLGTFFSRQGILRLENAIQERVDTLVSQLAKNHKNKPARMNDAFRSTTLDIITTYTLRSEIDVTSFPFFEHPVILSLNERLSTIWFFKHFPSFIQLSNILPRWLSAILMPSSVPQLATMKQVSKLVDEALQETQDKEENETDSNVFYTLIRNAGSKHQHKVTRGYLICEGWNLRIAGSDTVGNACTVGTWYLVQEDRVRKKLVSELDEAWPDRDGLMPLERLEKLPYLTAVIKECLRLSHGVVSPMSRIVADYGISIAGHPVPPGTVVGMANPFVHLNPDIFPEPQRFYPERWIETKDHSLDRYLVSFGKGPRSCLGINLAWSELYMILGNVYRKLDFKSHSDFEPEMKLKEYFVPVYEEDILNLTVTERCA